MGCSASRPDTLFTLPPPPPSIEVQQQQHQVQQAHACSSSSQSSSSSSYYSDCSSSTPISRTLSLPTPLVHHPPLRKGDADHLVSLTSTTYGSLSLLPHPRHRHHGKTLTPAAEPGEGEDPPSPSSPDSVINTWELMDGLDDLDLDSDYHIVQFPQKPSSDLANSSFVFVDRHHHHPAAAAESKPLWKHLSEESLLAKMDPNVVSSYRKALSARYNKVLDTDTDAKTVKPPVALSSNVSVMGNSSLLSNTNSRIVLPGTEDRIVLYYTSLRGIRRTFEDCCNVRDIFKGFRVYVDERDISMDSMYRKELQGVFSGKALTLPQVFIRGKLVGGVDEIKQLHEVGDLGKLLEDFEVRDHGYVCEICGDARFVPCPNCSGSRKVFDEEEEKLSRCMECNENGLIRCPNCCCA